MFGYVILRSSPKVEVIVDLLSENLRSGSIRSKSVTEFSILDATLGQKLILFHSSLNIDGTRETHFLKEIAPKAGINN